MLGKEISLYSKEIIKHFQNPQNMGEIKEPDGVGEVGNFICGDIMKLFIKVKKVKDKRIIKDIKFKTLGCAAAISTSSIITQLAKGKTIEEALKIKKDLIAKKLDLPPIKIHCSILAIDALNEAIYDYLSKNNLEIPKEVVENHLRIKKELKIAEKRYKVFVKAQKEFLK